MTRMLAAASMTSSVIVSSSFIFSTRLIWGKSRSRRRKLPRVIRSMAAMACASVKSSGSRVLPSRFQWRSRTKRSSSRPRARYWWENPSRLYSWGEWGKEEGCLGVGGEGMAGGWVFVLGGGVGAESFVNAGHVDQDYRPVGAV